MQEDTERECGGGTGAVGSVHEDPAVHTALLQVQEPGNHCCRPQVGTMLYKSIYMPPPL